MCPARRRAWGAASTLLEVAMQSAFQEVFVHHGGSGPAGRGVGNIAVLIPETVSIIGLSAWSVGFTILGDQPPPQRAYYHEEVLLAQVVVWYSE